MFERVKGCEVLGGLKPVVLVARLNPVGFVTLGRQKYILRDIVVS